MSSRRKYRKNAENLTQRFSQIALLRELDASLKKSTDLEALSGFSRLAIAGNSWYLFADTIEQRCLSNWMPSLQSAMLDHCCHLHAPTNLVAVWSSRQSETLRPRAFRLHRRTVPDQHWKANTARRSQAGPVSVSFDILNEFHLLR